MNFEGVVNHTYPIGIIRPSTNFKGVTPVLPNTPDQVSLNGTLDKYLNPILLNNAVATNSEITRKLSEAGAPVKINIESFKKNVYNHSVDTKNIAVGIYNKLPDSLKPQANLKDIAEGAILHDLGKVLIPESILTKKGQLNDKEKAIMELHSDLSYQLLRNQGVGNNVLNIVRFHHQNPKQTGYPNMLLTHKMNLDGQIVALADKYSALREKRSYKAQMTEAQALEILRNEVNKGVSPQAYEALNKYVTGTKINPAQNNTTIPNTLYGNNGQRMQHKNIYV